MNKRYIVNFILNGILGISLIFILEYSYFRIVPVTHFFKYQSVASELEEIKIGDPLIMVSTSQYNRSADINWNDILRCDLGEGSQYYSFYESSADNYKPKQGFKVIDEGNWRYGGKVPTVPAKCFMSSTITASLQYGVEKQMSLESNTFQFIP